MVSLVPDSAGRTTQAPPRWALEGALNPTVLRLHVSVELTSETILTCPPGYPPAPIDLLLGVRGVRSVDLHRYRVRLNLGPGGGRASVTSAVTALLRDAWGDPVPLPPEPDLRAFALARSGPRVVAESPVMAAASGEPVLAGVFAVTGVVEAIAGADLALVKLGRLFGWDVQTGEAVAAAVRSASRSPSG
jgi:hypothetical protein